MSEGTSLEEIESGNVAYTADTAAMNAILSDMNAVEEAPVYIPPPQVQHQPQVQPQYQPQPQVQPQFVQEPFQPEAAFQFPQFPQFPQPAPMYEAVEEPKAQPVQHTPKKNAWSTAFDDIREPLVVGLLVSLFSLPGLHTWLAKRLTWAYKVGGSLSWIGFLLQFVLVSGLFATYRQIMQVAGL